MYQIFFYFFIFICTFLSYTQESDTVYIHEAPLVVRKQVVIQKERKQLLNLEDWFLKFGVGFSSFSNFQEVDSISVKSHPFFLPTIAMGKKMGKNWNLQLGINYLSTKSRASYNQKNIHNVDVPKVRYDTLGSYVIILPTGSKTVYTLDTINYVEKEQIVRDSSVNQSVLLNYVGFPLQIGYQLNYPKMYVEPFVIFTYYLGLKSTFLTNENRRIHSAQFFSAALGTQLGYRVSTHLGVELAAMYQFHSFRKSHQMLMSQKTIQVCVKYFF